jgi:hypothetical protein
MSRLARGPRFRDGRLALGLSIWPAGRGPAMSTVVVVVLLRLVRSFVACLAVRRCLAALRGMAARRRARTFRHGRLGRGGRGPGRWGRGPGTGGGGLGRGGLGRAVHDRDRCLGGHGRRLRDDRRGRVGGWLSRGVGRRCDGWSGRLPFTRVLGLARPGRCRVPAWSGRRRCRAGGARRGRARGRERRPCGRDRTDFRGRSRRGQPVAQGDRGQDEVDDAKGEHEPEALRTAHVDPRLPQSYRWLASSSPLATMVAPVRRSPSAQARVSPAARPRSARSGRVHHR